MGHLVLSGGLSDVQQPVVGKVTAFVARNTAGTTDTVDTSSDGRFQVTVLPGAYTLTGWTPMYEINGQQGVCRARHKVTVVSGEEATANVYCEGK